MGKYKIGDKFLIEIEDDVLMEHGVLYKIKGFNALVFDEYGLDKLQKYEEEKYRPSELDKYRQKAYEEGMKEAWEVARSICCEEEDGGIPVIELSTIFNNSITGTLRTFSAIEAKEKIDAWRKSKCEIKVGEVVKHVYDGTKGIVMDITPKDELMVFTENGCIETWSNETVYRTNIMYDVKNLIASLGTV